MGSGSSKFFKQGSKGKKSLEGRYSVDEPNFNSVPVSPVSEELDSSSKRDTTLSRRSTASQSFSVFGRSEFSEVTPSDPVKTNKEEFLGAPQPMEENTRWNYLCDLNILDSEPEQRFDDITKLCCMIFKVPIALVSLVDKERQWFKSVQGLPVRETDRRSSFCAWTLLPQYPEVLVVENALEDVRFRNNPLVLGFPHIRFYCGSPLVGTNGTRLGSLCIIDSKSRQFDAESCILLANMAEMVVREIEKEKMLEHQKAKSALLTKENKQLLRAMDCFSEGIILVNVSDPKWPVVYMNEAFSKVTGLGANDPSLARGFWDVFKTRGADPTKIFQQTIAASENFQLTAAYEGGTMGRKWLKLEFRNANNATMDNYMPLVGIPSILANSTDAAGSVYYFATVLEQPRTSVDVQRNSGDQPAITLLSSKLDPFDDVKMGPLLGKGAYGRVYRATWKGSLVAVKVLEHLKSEEGGVDSVEALLSGQLSHPNVVQSYKYHTRVVTNNNSLFDDKHAEVMETWMILEFCNKGSLSDGVERGWFRRKVGLFEVEYKAVLATAREVAGAMCYLHSRNILHADLTGNNILLCSSAKDERRFTAKVADFGLSRVLEGNTQYHNTKSYGTVTHMPPELLLDGTLGRPADVYAFGVILWELYMGQRPYAGLSHGQIIHHITTRKTLVLPSACPASLAKLIDSCFLADPDQRPTFAQILKILDDIEDDLVTR